MKRFIIWVLLVLSVMAGLLMADLTFDQIRELEKTLPGLKGRFRIDLLNKLADEYRFENPNKALGFANEALKLAEQENYLTEAGYAHLQVALCLKSTDKDTGRKHIHSAGEIFKKTKDNKGLVNQLIVQGLYLADTDQDTPQKSIDMYTQAIELCTDKDEFVDELKKIYVYLAMYYRKTGNIADSNRYLHQGLEIIKDEYDKAYYFNQLAINFAMQKDIKKELDYFIKAAEIYKKLKIDLRLARVLENIGMTYMELKEYDRALSFFNQALAYYRDDQFLDFRLQTLLNMAEIYAKLKNYNEAGQIFTECQTIIPRINDYFIRFRFYESISNFYFVTQRYKESRETLQEYIRYKDKYMDEEKAKEYVKAQEKFNTKIKEKEVVLLKKEKRYQLIIFAGLLAIFLVLSVFLIRKFHYLLIFWRKQKYIGQYRIVERIGGGGMGNVYKAHGLKDKKRIVAIKVLKEELFESEENIIRFKREGEVIDRLDHPNIVKVIERGESDNRYYIVLEYLQGRTLDQIIAAGVLLPLPACVEIMRQMASAVAAIHEKGIIHRDLKPANIMVKETGNGRYLVKLLDFGLSKLWFHSRLTQSGMLVGTLSYHAPEQVKNLESSFASDIYSLGIIFYELLSGKLLYQGESLSSITQKILKGTLPPLESLRQDLPEELTGLVMKMVAKKEKMRLSIKEIKAHLG